MIDRIDTIGAIRLISAICAPVLLLACTDRAANHWTGYAEAELVYVSAPVSGTVKLMPVARGNRVEVGAPLFTLDSDIELLARSEAEALLAQAESTAANLRKGRRPAEIVAAEQQLAQAQAALTASRADYQRERDLAAKGFVSAGRLDTLLAQQERDVARVREMQAQLALAREPARSDEIAAAEAQARAARAQLGQDSWRAAQTQQMAPVAGIVYDVLFRVGERVPVAQPVVVLLPDQGLKARFFVPTAALGGLKLGDKVQLACDGCPPNLAAAVNYISAQAEFTPPVIYSNEARDKLVFRVEALPDAAARAVLKPGMPLTVAPGVSAAVPR